MNDGMESARHVVTVPSPEFLRADWPRFEWNHIVANDPNNTRGVLLPILLRDLTKDGKERMELCARFRDLRYIDFRKPAEFKRSFVEWSGAFAINQPNGDESWSPSRRVARCLRPLSAPKSRGRQTVSRISHLEFAAGEGVPSENMGSRYRLSGKKGSLGGRPAVRAFHPPR